MPEKACESIPVKIYCELCKRWHRVKPAADAKGREIFVSAVKCPRIASLRIVAITANVIFITPSSKKAS